MEHYLWEIISLVRSLHIKQGWISLSKSTRQRHHLRLSQSTIGLPLLFTVNSEQLRLTALPFTLRRVPYPFSDESYETKIKIYHDAHSQWETRAPIRAMTFEKIDGKDTLVAAYACSPLVLIPVADLRNGAHIEGHVIGDMGNGQPISMFNFKYNGEDSIFVTNAAHNPRIISVASLQHAKVITEANSPNKPHEFISDTTGLPWGSVGNAVMFVGSSLHADLLNDKFISSLTRNANSGKLILESLPTFPLPMHLDELWSEFDFGPRKDK